MKILLVQLYNGKDIEPIYPLGLSYLSTALAAHDIIVFDQNICDNDPFGETGKILLEFSPDVVGLSMRNIRLYSRSTENYSFQNQLKATIRAEKLDSPEKVKGCFITTKKSRKLRQNNWFVPLLLQFMKSNNGHGYTSLKE